MSQGKILFQFNKFNYVTDNFNYRSKNIIKRKKGKGGKRYFLQIKYILKSTQII